MAFGSAAPDLVVGGRDQQRLQLRQKHIPQSREEIFGDDFCISLYGPRRHLGLDVGEPLFKEARHRQPGRLDGGAPLQFCEQPSSLHLRLPLRASEAMPAPLALTGYRIADVDDDGPMAGRAFADVAFHSFFPFSILSWSTNHSGASFISSAHSLASFTIDWTISSPRASAIAWARC